jgi:hypothetical protein
MGNIDIPVNADIQAMFDIPPCMDLRLPHPSPMQITLPTGSVIKAISDISKGVPTDCSASFSLLLQLTPILANLECLLRILKLLGALIKVIKGLPFPPIKAIKDFVAAAGELAPCLAIPFNVPGLLQMIHDILCLILKMLKCLIGGLTTVVKTMKGLGLQLKIAEKDNNQDLMQSLQCAQENAATSAEHLTASLEPLKAILALVTPIMDLAGMPAFKLPEIGSSTDVEALEKTLATLKDGANTLDTIVSALPGGACA